jgi:hypothetical protein
MNETNFRFSGTSANEAVILLNRLSQIFNNATFGAGLGSRVA